MLSIDAMVRFEPQCQESEQKLANTCMRCVPLSCRTKLAVYPKIFEMLPVVLFQIIQRYPNQIPRKRCDGHKYVGMHICKKRFSSLLCQRPAETVKTLYSQH